MKRRLLYTILSISLLTVMAGAAIVSPSARLMHTSPYAHSYDIDPHSYDIDPLEEGRAFKEQSLFACKQAAA